MSRGANGILLVYDITNPKSFDNISKWLRNINEHASEDVERMLIGKKSNFDASKKEGGQRLILGNKCDMEEKRLISKERGEKVAEENGIKFYETSAKENVNIEHAFITVSWEIVMTHAITVGFTTFYFSLPKTS